MSSNPLAKKVRRALRFLPDRAYIQLNYFARFHRFADLDHPKTYNEKLNWLKLHDHNPLYPRIVDKCEVKKYVDGILGPGYCIPTLGVWERFEDIDLDALPDAFVLKCTHDSEGLVIVPDRKAFDKKAAEEKISAALKQNFYYIGREWPYKSVPPRIIAEPYLEDSETGELRDYKFFCFGGKPEVMFIASGRAGVMTADYYDMDFNHLEIRRKFPNSPVPLKKPAGFETMKELAGKLSKDFPHVRADFYEADGRVYFGELTLYHGGGWGRFYPDKWDRIFGDMIILPGGADA